MLDATAEKVWQKAIFVDAENEAKGFRKDACGAWINRSAHGDRENTWGWEVDHIVLQSQGGTDHIDNLRPLHWRNNAARQTNQMVCVVKSSGTKNIAV